MPAILLALVCLVAIGLGIAWFLRANPSTVARRLRLILVVLAAVGIGGLLIFGVRFLPSFLPELFGLAGFVVTGLVARALRHRPSGGFRTGHYRRGGFSTPGTGQRTEARTAFFEAWIDHATGDVGGRVLQGRFAGRGFDDLTDAEAHALRAACASDPESLRILEAYLDHRLGPQWRQGDAKPGGGKASTGEMSRGEALAVLGLAEGATDEDIRTAHRRLVQRVHPDVGGSADLAARINRAKDILLGR